MASATPGYCTFTATSPPVAGDGAVHLTDARRGDGHNLPVEKDPFGWLPELVASPSCAASAGAIGVASDCNVAIAFWASSGALP